MIEYLLRRLPSLVFLVLASSIIAFGLPRMAPGDPAVAVAGPDASPSVVAAVRTELGLDRPVPEQYLEWITGVLRGDLGDSLTTHRAVAELVGARLGSTLELAVAATLVMVVLGIGLGVALAVARRGPVRAALDTVTAVLLAAPPFLSGLVLIVLFGITWQVLPVSGEVSMFEDPSFGIQYLLLPALALALPQAAAVARLLANSMTETASEDFVDLARSKGVPAGRVWRRHVLRNSMGPALVTIGLRVGELLAGAIVVEAIFGRHGLGGLAVTSVQTRDYPVIQALIVAAVLVAALIQILSDLGVAYLDPRVRLGAAS